MPNWPELTQEQRLYVATGVAFSAGVHHALGVSAPEITRKPANVKNELIALPQIL